MAKYVVMYCMILIISSGHSHQLHAHDDPIIPSKEEMAEMSSTPRTDIFLRKLKHEGNCEDCRFVGNEVGEIIKELKKKDPQRVISLKRSTFTDCHFFMIDLSHVNFEASTFHNSFFYKTNLYKTNFKTVQGLSLSNFDGVKNMVFANWADTPFASHGNWKIVMGLWLNKKNRKN